MTDSGSPDDKWYRFFSMGIFPFIHTLTAYSFAFSYGGRYDSAENTGLNVYRPKV
jgi:hypothetical protein